MQGLSPITFAGWGDNITTAPSREQGRFLGNDIVEVDDCARRAGSDSMKKVRVPRASRQADGLDSDVGSDETNSDVWTLEQSDTGQPSLGERRDLFLADAGMCRNFFPQSSPRRAGGVRSPSAVASASSGIFASRSR